MPLAFLGTFELRQAFFIALHGCALLTLGILFSVSRFTAVASPLWQSHARWMGMYGIAKAVSVVGSLVLGATNRGLEPEVFRILYAIAAGGAYWAAIEFFRRSMLAGSRVAAVSSLALLGACALAIWLDLQWMRLAVPILATIAAAGIGWLVLAEIRRRDPGPPRPLAQHLALAMFAIGVAGLAGMEWFGLRYMDRFQGWTFNTGFIPKTMTFVWVGALFSWIGLLGWWSWARSKSATVAALPAGPWRRRLIWAIPLGFIAIVAIGFRLMTWLNDSAKERINQSYFAQLRMATRLGGFSRAEPGELGRILAVIRDSSPQARRAIVWTARDGQVVPLAQSEPEHSPYAMKLGAPWRPVLWNEKQALLRDEPAAFFQMPFEETQGILVSFNLPLPPAASDAGTRWLALHLQARDWLRAKSGSHTPAVLMMVVIAALGIFFLVYQMRREFELALSLAKTRAEEESRAKSELLAFMSHELRTPLQSVIGYAEVLQRAPQLPGQKHPLEAIQSQGRLLLRMIGDVLDFSAAEAHRVRLQPAPFPLSCLLQDCEMALAPLAREKGLALQVERDAPEDTWLLGDVERLKQILVNLLGNAVKFTVAGHVTLTAVARDAGGGRVHCEFRVRDSGVGIPPEDRHRLFQPFVRLDQAGAAPGAGLGLALVKRLCDLMAGSLAVESAPGVGSTFSFVVTLPRGLPGFHAARGAPRRFAPAPVLIAEDNLLIRELLLLHLRTLGFEPHAVSDGEAAVSECQRRPFPVVLMDLRMPGRLDGLAAARRIRELAGSSADRPWIIGCSASLLSDEREHCRRSGMQAFLPKPVMFEELATALTACPWLHIMEGPAGEPGAAERAEKSSPFSETAGHFGAGPAERFIDCCQDDTPQRLAVLRSGVERRDGRAVVAVAHYLKNTALFFGDDLMADAFAQCEQTAANGTWEAGVFAAAENAAMALLSRIPRRGSAVAGSTTALPRAGV